MKVIPQPLMSLEFLPKRISAQLARMNRILNALVNGLGGLERNAILAIIKEEEAYRRHQNELWSS